MEREYDSLSSDDEEGPVRESIGADDWGSDDEDGDVDVSERPGNALESVDFV